MTTFQPVPFGKYVLLERIGVCPTAELFRARGANKKPVLIKKILSQFSADQPFVSSMKEAVRVARLLHHPNILQIQDFGRLDDTWYIATDYLPGRTLQEVLFASKENAQPVGVPCALHITEQICRGLQYAHGMTDSQGNAHHIVHGNISPQNILITYNGEIKITDFGGTSAQNQDNNSRMGMFKGKVAYMSPEQVDGRAIDCRSDLFSIGTLLYEMATGRRAFDGETVQVFSHVRQARFEPPEKIVNGLPPELCQVIQRALQKEPENRFSSADDMLGGLDQVMSKISPQPGAEAIAEYLQNLFTERTEVETRLYNTASDTPAKAVALDTGSNVRHETPDPESAIIHKDKEKKQTASPYPGKKAKNPTQTDSSSESGKTATNPQVNAAREKQALDHMSSSVQISSSHRTTKTEVVESNPSTRKLALWSAIAATVVISFIGFALLSNLNRKWATEEPKKAESPKVGAGLEALKAGRFDKAVSLFDEVLADEPAMAYRVSKPYAEALEGQACEFVKTDLKQAEKLLVQAVKFDAQRASTFSRLGLVYLKQKDFANAAKSYEKAVQLDGTSADTFFNLGYIYAVQENYAKAEIMYARVVDLAPSFLDEALFNLAMVQDKQGKTTQSARNLELAIKANPKNKQAKQYLKKLTG